MRFRIGTPIPLCLIFLGLSAVAQTTVEPQKTYVIKANEARFVAVKEDPYLLNRATDSNSKKYLLRTRIFDHNVKNPGAIKDMIDAAERVYSQCPGIEVKIQVLEYVKPQLAMRPHEFESTDPKSGKFLFTREFLDSFPKGPRNPNVVDIHMVDVLTSGARAAEVSGNLDADTGSTYEGKAFYPPFIARNHAAQEGPLSQQELLALNNSLLVAMHTYARQDGKFSSIVDRRFVVVGGKTEMVTDVKLRIQHFSKTLLAHELGHLVLENQTSNVFIDHFCPGLGGDCKKEYLMSSGGATEAAYLKPKSDQILGYAPMAKLDPLQCKHITTSPFFELVR